MMSYLVIVLYKVDFFSITKTEFRCWLFLKVNIVDPVGFVIVPVRRFTEMYFVTSASGSSIRVDPI